MTRTFVIGEATKKQKEIYNIVRESNQAGIDAVEANVPLKKFDLKARKIIDDSGYGDYFNNRIGHGLGIEVHEAPSIHEKNEQIAEPGLFFTIEPGIYIPGRSEEHTSELQSRGHLVCRLLLEKKKRKL